MSFWHYLKDANILWSIFLPIITIALIWFLTFLSLRIWLKAGRLKKVFIIHKTLIICSLLVAMILVSIICYSWAKNLLTGTHMELALILSLIVTFGVSIVSFFVLQSYWEKTKVSEITPQPVSAVQAQNDIPFINKAFHKIKIWYLMPFIGFLFLLFSINSGRNLISVVYDNSTSMNDTRTNAINALSQTFGKLGKNNEIIFANLNNGNSELATCRRNIREILSIKQSSKIKVGSCLLYNIPEEAKQSFESTLGEALGSPICEVIWKMWLYTKEINKTNFIYKNVLLIIITDGDDGYINEDLKINNKFIFDDKEFAGFYAPENTFIVDYSDDGNGILLEKFRNYGATVYPAVTSVDDYLSALDDALISFQKNIYLIVWTIVICIIGTIMGLLINPKKITI